MIKIIKINSHNVEQQLGEYFEYPTEILNASRDLLSRVSDMVQLETDEQQLKALQGKLRFMIPDIERLIDQADYKLEEMSAERTSESET